MMRTNDEYIQLKSKAFAIKCIHLYQVLCKNKKCAYLASQLLKSGTNIGCHIKEATLEHSNKDFGAKINTALKEAHKSAHWLELLVETDYIETEEFKDITADCQTIIRMLTPIVNSTLTR